MKWGACIKNCLGLFFPDTCYACNNLLSGQEKFICIHCRISLPRTRFHLYQDNPLARVFWGRVRIQTGTALYHFHQLGGVQKLVHTFKYKGHISLGEHLGRLLGQDLISSPHYKNITSIVPVPLHPGKAKRRGFNQSEVLARGISSVMGVPCKPHWLVRTHDTPTQTKRSRIDRWENVSTSFRAANTPDMVNAQILLVDDVLTTGATLEACAQELLSASGCRVWIATLAITE